MTEARHWLLLSAAMGMIATAGQPPAPPPRSPPSTSADVPDAEFIEFLGEDDHGDAAWWEFLNKAPPDPEEPPPPDAPR